MNKCKAWLLCLSLTACTASAPVAVIGENGEIMRGTTSASMLGGEFKVSNGARTCSGNYNIQHGSQNITVNILCNDGHKGLAFVTRDKGGRSGSGRVRMDDGTEADFVFGKAAEAF